MNIFRYYEVWGRIVSETPINKDVDLAELLGISASNITRRKKEDIFPIEWAFRVAQAFDLTTEWLLTGREPKSFSKSITSQNVENRTLQEADIWLKELINNEPRRVEWFAVAFEDAFPMFKEWKKRRDSSKWDEDSSPDSKIA